MTKHSFLSNLSLAVLCMLVLSASSKLSQVRRLDVHSSHDAVSVNADDHIHAFELHECTGAALELTGDATLRVRNVDNAMTFLVTDKELDDCDEIDNLRCKPGNKFCRTWPSTIDQNVELQLKDFAGGHAHFYVKHHDKNRGASITIELKPKGLQNSAVNSHHHQSHGIDTKAVEDDNHYHALVIKACTGTILELPSDNDHLVDVSNVDNAKRYMVTDVELEDCNEIKSLTCKPGSTFCHIWSSHDDEVLLLNKTSFPKKEAFFYVEANDEKKDVSVNVKVTPAIQDEHGIHAIDDHDHEQNTGEGHGEHIAAHIDSDNHVHALQLKTCNGAALEMTGDSTIEVKNVYNAKRYMVSNLELKSCEEIAAFQCLGQATFCHIWNANADEKVILKYPMFTNGEAYFYAEPQDAKHEVSVNVKLVPQGEQVKPAHHSNHDEQHVVVDSHTHALEIQACSGATLELKGDTVLIAHDADNAHSFLVTDKELATCDEIANFRCHDAANICHNWAADSQDDVLLEITDFPNAEAHFYVKPVDAQYAVAVNVKLDTLSAYNVTDGKAHPGHLVNANEGGLPGHIKNLLMEGAIVLLFVLVTMSYCYRRYLWRYKQAPFSAPFWCPNFLFPVPDSESVESFISNEQKKQETQELQAGIIRQVEV